MRQLLKASILAAALTLACATSTAFDNAPRFEIVGREQTRRMDGEISYWLVLGFRDANGYRSERIRVGQMVYLQLKDRSEACLYTNGIRPCQ